MKRWVSGGDGIHVAIVACHQWRRSNSEASSLINAGGKLFTQSLKKAHETLVINLQKESKNTVYYKIVL
jgi:hypothetical protein